GRTALVRRQKPAADDRSRSSAAQSGPAARTRRADRRRSQKPSGGWNRSAAAAHSGPRDRIRRPQLHRAAKRLFSISAGTEWQEPGTRRAAFYSDLHPGTYRFRVIASNNDGVWNEEGASADFVVAPTWYQTNSFLVLSIVTGLAMVWTAYRIHMRQVARAL